jgi:hypothetical protein
MVGGEKKGVTFRDETGYHKLKRENSIIKDGENATYGKLTHINAIMDLQKQDRKDQEDENIKLTYLNRDFRGQQHNKNESGISMFNYNTAPLPKIDNKLSITKLSKNINPLLNNKNANSDDDYLKFKTFNETKYMEDLNDDDLIYFSSLFNQDTAAKIIELLLAFHQEIKSKKITLDKVNLILKSNESRRLRSTQQQQ